MKDAALKDFRRIPGVGEKIAGLLWGLGFESVRDLKGQDPERMYERLCEMRGQHVDRCVLYVFRCAVYFAGDGPHDAKLLRWWNWKDAANQEKAM